MNELPPENRLELREAHAGIGKLVFRSLAIEVKNTLPFRRIGRRPGADQGSPLDHRETGFSQAGDGTNNHHRDDHTGADE